MVVTDTLGGKREENESRSSKVVDLIHHPGIGTGLKAGAAGHALFAVSPRLL